MSWLKVESYSTDDDSYYRRRKARVSAEIVYYGSTYEEAEKFAVMELVRKAQAYLDGLYAKGVEDEHKNEIKAIRKQLSQARKEAREKK